MNDCGREDQDLKFGMDIGGCDEGAWPHDYYNWLMYRNGRRAQMEFCSSPYLREVFKKKRRNIWKIPYVRGGHFLYVITKDFYCILSYFKPF